MPEAVPGPTPLDPAEALVAASPASVTDPVRSNMAAASEQDAIVFFCVRDNIS